MTNFQLDTSGFVDMKFLDSEDRHCTYWRNLSPFKQGYTAAALLAISERRKVLKASIPADLVDAIFAAEGWPKVEGEVRTRHANTAYIITRDNKAGVYVATPKPIGFSDLAPETLERIREDCAAILRGGYEDTRESGRSFWINRQAGRHPASAQPLILYLDDNGKVRFQ